MLSNGSVFITESLVEETLRVGGVEGLSFLLLSNLAHIVKNHTRENVMNQ